jgi:endonuclease/exonuclease/phosphatase family metal-dependent hydrolase
MNLTTVVLLAAAVTLSADAENGGNELHMKVLSFNIRYGTANDGTDSWPHRRELVFDVIEDESPDFCGLQEALRFQIDEIRETLPQYAEHGSGRDDGQKEGEYCAILYRRDRWKLDVGETLWLSETPSKPGSTSWGNTIPRIVTWGRFVERRTGRHVNLFNTHFDHRSQPSRIRSAEFIAQLIARKASNSPVVLMGDLNAGEDNPAIERLKRGGDDAGIRLEDTFRVLHPSAEDVGTFNGFEGRTDGPKIDYVFTNAALRVESARIVSTHRGSRYPSDHFPVSAELVLPAE